MRSYGLAIKTISITLLTLWAAGAEAEVKETGIKTIAPQHSGSPVLADVDLYEEPIAHAMRLLAETYDVSIATGALPDTKVTIRLRSIGAQDAFAAVAAAAGLEVVQDGSVVRLASRGQDAVWRQAAPCSMEADCAVAAVKPAPAGRGACCWNGCGNAGNNLQSQHQPQMADRVFPLGVAPGEETLKAVQSLLGPCELATYNAVENLVTVSALLPTMERIEGLLGDLTRTPKQYEIEVQVVEVSRNALRQMGSQGTFGLDIRGGVLASTFPLSGLNAAKRYLPSANDLAALSRFGTVGGVPSGSTEPGSFADPGFRFGQIDARGIGLMIQALEQSGEARVMATPKVTALDNRKARISMVTTLRIPTFTQNQSFGTTTVSGIEQVDVGTTLEVRPRHGAGRQIVLTVSPEVSELQPNSSAVTQNGLTQGLPIVTRRRTETEVVLESGETLIIGGLVTEHKMETHGKTPGLGDIPLIGRAFRLEGKQTENTELLVFVTPRELPSPEERRSKVRVGETWLPFNLAAQLEGGRALLHGQAAADRVAGVRALEAIDADLRDAGVDTGREIVALGGDASLDVRAAALLFLLHVRPAAALGELARFKDSRAVALAALAAPVAPIAPHLHAALAELAWQAPPSPSSPTSLPAGTEPALSWGGTPEEIALSGDAAGIELVRAALDLLARRAPDLRHFVGFGLATVETGAAKPSIDPAVRSARVVTINMIPERVALQMVRLATLAFETRVAGIPAADGRNLALAVQEETRALERMTGGGGVSASATASPAVRDALAAGLRWIAADAPGTAIRSSSSIATLAGGSQ
ncbi:MAG TPA: type II and III secretion system protein [Thermoanaerobaculia bacterium]|nr:type II and III secretion system protein [Thermoanaerobaculia bacterium]